MSRSQQNLPVTTNSSSVLAALAALRSDIASIEPTEQPPLAFEGCDDFGPLDQDDYDYREDGPVEPEPPAAETEEERLERAIAAFKPIRKFHDDPSEQEMADIRRRLRVKLAHVDDQASLDCRTALNELVASIPSSFEGHGIMLTGPSGSGKSHVLERFRTDSKFREFEMDTGEGYVRPLAYILAPAPCTLKALGVEIYQALTGIPVRNNVREYEIWTRVRAQLAASRTTILVIDEMHHVLLNKDEEESEKIAETFKNVMQNPDWPVFFVFGGMPTASTFAHTHEQLERRLVFKEFAPLPNNAAGYTALAKYVDVLVPRLGFPKKFSLTEGDMPQRLHIASNGYRGLAANLVKAAANRAIDVGAETILVDDLRDAYAATFQKANAPNPFDGDTIGGTPLSKLGERKGRLTKLRGRKGRGNEDG